MLWTYFTHANNSGGEKKFLYVGQWPLKEKGQAEVDMDGISEDRIEKVKPIQGYGSGAGMTGMAKHNLCS